MSQSKFDSVKALVMLWDLHHRQASIAYDNGHVPALLFHLTAIDEIESGLLGLGINATPRYSA